MNMTILTFGDFQDLVAKMRHAQKKYYKTRTTDDLQAAKKMEVVVDTFLERMSRKHEVPSLFEEGELL